MRFFRWIVSLFRKPAPITHGAYVFCGWADPRPEFGLVPGVQCPTATPWERMPTRIPSRGQYDERDPIVTQKRCGWMQQGKVDYAVYQVDWRHDTHELLMAHCAENHPTESPIKFCLSFFDVLHNAPNRTYYNDLTPEQISDSQKAFAESVRTFTSRSNYLCIGNRPVLFLGYAETTSPSFIDIIRAGIPNVYLVATAVIPDAQIHLKAKGFDAFTEYLLYSANWTDTVATYRYWWQKSIEVCKQTGIDYWVPATCGYDARPQGIMTPVFMPTPEEFTAHLREARQFASDNSKYTRGQVVTYAWSEFREGGILEPMADLPGNLHRGDEMLRAHARAVA